MRLLVTSIILALVLCIPFLIWGEHFRQWFIGDAAIQWIRGWGAWGWLAVIGLLVSDLFLPIPATPVMSAAGYLFGTFTGGLISAALLSRYITSLLFQVQPSDPVVYLAVGLVLLLVALLASYLPARRAAKIDPMVALRTE